MQGAQFANDDEQRAAGEAFALTMFDKESGRLTTLEDSRQAFEERLQAAGIEGSRIAQIADQVFSREERVAGEEFGLTFENLQQTGRERLQGASFQNEDEQRIAGEAFALVLFNKETDRITTLEEGRQEFESQLQDKGIEADRASQIADQVFKGEQAGLDRAAAVDIEQLRTNGQAMLLTMQFANDDEQRQAGEAFQLAMFGEETERITDLEEGRQAFEKELQAAGIEATRATQIADQMFLSKEAELGRTQELTLQNLAQQGQESLQSAQFANEAEQTKAGEAFALVMHDKETGRVTSLQEAQQSFEERLQAIGISADRASQLSDQVFKGEQAGLDRAAAFDLEQMRTDSQETLLTMQFANNREERKATQAFQDVMFGKETDRLTSMEEGRQAFETALQDKGIEAARASQIADQLFLAKESEAERAQALTMQNIDQAGRERLQSASFANDDEQRLAGEAFALTMHDKETGRLTTLAESREKFEERLQATGIEANRASQIADQVFLGKEAELDRAATFDLETMRTNSQALLLTMQFDNNREERKAKQAFEKFMFGEETERITTLEDGRQAFQKELQDNGISAERAAQISDQMFSAEMQDDAQAFASGEAKEGRTHALLMQSTAISADDKARAETIAASVDEAALARLHAGDQNALDRAVQDKQITKADAQFYAGLAEQVRATDQSDATTKYGIDVGAESAEADRQTRVDVLHTTIAAEDRARADRIAANLEITEINNSFSGKENALNRAVEEKRISQADARYYAGSHRNHGCRGRGPRGGCTAGRRRRRDERAAYRNGRGDRRQGSRMQRSSWPPNG